MHRLLNGSRWVVSGALLFGIGGCVTNQQMFDFTRMELSRVVADALGRALQFYLQGQL